MLLPGCNCDRPDMSLIWCPERDIQTREPCWAGVRSWSDREAPRLATARRRGRSKCRGHSLGKAAPMC